jgi:hypothetical protein
VLEEENPQMARFGVRRLPMRLPASAPKSHPRSRGPKKRGSQEREARS